MQQKRPLDYLLPAVRQHVLAVLLLNPPHPWYLAELGQRLNLHHATLQRELTALEHAGVVRSWKEGNRTYFAPDTDCPFLPELRLLLLKTVGLADKIREALIGLEGKMDLVFVYGSIASGQETSQSDVDLMVIGDVTLSELAGCLRPLERELN